MLARSHRGHVQQGLREVAKGVLRGIRARNGVGISAGWWPQARNLALEQAKDVLTEGDDSGIKRAGLVVKPRDRVRDDRARRLDRGDGLLWRLSANAREVNDGDSRQGSNTGVYVVLERKINHRKG